MLDVGVIFDDLAQESQELDDTVAALPETDWALPTPAEGWTIAHQIAHLAWTDQKSLLAVRAPAEFPAEMRRVLAEGSGVVDAGAAEGAAKPVATLLADWRRGRADLSAALLGVPAGTKIPWYGPEMSAPSMATARLMETWAHGQDVADALGSTREPTARLWQIARFGVRTRDFAFALHAMAPPDEEFRVELTAPGGDTWEFGPVDAAQRIAGSALDLCLLVTQRRHRADTDLRAAGQQAEQWLSIAQAFAGPPGSGRKAGQFG